MVALPPLLPGLNTLVDGKFSLGRGRSYHLPIQSRPGCCCAPSLSSFMLPFHRFKGSRLTRVSSSSCVHSSAPSQSWLAPPCSLLLLLESLMRCLTELIAFTPQVFVGASPRRPSQFRSSQFVPLMHPSSVNSPSLQLNCLCRGYDLDQLN